MRKILVIGLMLAMCHVDGFAQVRKQATTVRRKTTAAVAKPKAPVNEIKRYRQLGADGRVWYKVKKDGLFGASDADGKEILPILYSKIEYICSQI